MRRILLKKESDVLHSLQLVIRLNMACNMNSFVKSFNMESRHWGIIGPGNIACQFAADLQLLEKPQPIFAVLSHRKESAAEFAAEWKIKGSYTGLAEFLQHPGLNAVYIATPHPHHFDQALACLEKGLPVLCEKPLTLNAEQTGLLIKASQKNKTFLMEGLWIRFLPAIRQLLSIIDQGMIGNIVSINASISFKADQDEDNRFFNPELGGGSLLDLGIYPIFLAYSFYLMTYIF